MKHEIEKRMKPKPAKTILSVRIRADLRARLKAEAKASNRFEQEIVEAALEYALQDAKGKKRKGEK